MAAPATPQNSRAPAATNTPYHDSTGGFVIDRKQSDLKPLIQQEVAGVVFESALVPFLFFPQQPRLQKLVPSYAAAKPLVDKLDKRYVTQEDAAYDPLVKLFQFIVDGVAQEADNEDKASTPAAKKKQKRKKTNRPPAKEPGRPLARILFRAYNRQVLGNPDGAGKLKPDGLGGDRSDPEYDTLEAVQWRTIWIAIEVKNSWPEALQQALTYARCMLEVGDKWFALVLVYHHPSRALRFCFATRMGVFLSSAWDLSEPAEFAQAASALVHACHAPRTTEAGFDAHRFLADDGTRLYNLPQLGLFATVDTVCARIQVHGRATHVHELTPILPEAIQKGPELHDPPGLSTDVASAADAEQLQRTGQLQQGGQPSAPRPRRAVRSTGVAANPRQKGYTAGLATRKLPGVPEDDSEEEVSSVPPPSPAPIDTKFEEWLSFCTRSSLVWREDKPPPSTMKSLVVKDVWPFLERLETEILVLNAVHDKYAFVRYLGHMTLPHPGMERLEAFRNAPVGAESWKSANWRHVYPDGAEPKFNPRVHRLIFYENKGSSLESIAEDPWAMAQSVKDIFTALYILFLLGWLHRDISIGNILALRDYIKNSLEVLEELSKTFNDPRFERIRGIFAKQRSFLSDFDQAVKWDEDRKHQPGRSGTPAFMASERSTAWVLQQEWLDTLFDDLEAVIWTHFYAVLRAARESGAFSILEKRHFATFNGDDAYFLTAVKEWIMSYSTADGPPPGHSVLGPTWPLWRRLFTAAAHARASANTLKTRLREAGLATFVGAGDDIREELKAACKDAVLVYLEAVYETLTVDFAHLDPDRASPADDPPATPVGSPLTTPPDSPAATTDNLSTTSAERPFDADADPFI